MYLDPCLWKSYGADPYHQ